jgi:GTPase SAR1 family protein
MKYKIVFLGDQGVGKTSLILRFTQDSFDVKYMVSDPLDPSNQVIGDNRYWLFDKDSLCRRQNGETLVVGHGGIGEIQEFNPQLH